MDTETNPEAMEDATDGTIIDESDFDENAVCFRLGDYRDADMLTKAGHGEGVSMLVPDAAADDRALRPPAAHVPRRPERLARRQPE